MPEEVGHEFVFLHKRSVGSAVACLIIGEMPFCEVPCRDGESDRQPRENFRYAEAQVYREAVICLVEPFQLATEVCDYGRERHVVVGIVIVDAQICRHSESGICLITAVKHFQCDASAQTVGDVV